MSSQFFRFVVVGAAGFIVDATVLYLALGWGFNALEGRLLSFFIAVIFTWILNRRFTFAGQQPKCMDGISKEWFQYVVAMAAGGIVNFGVFGMVIAVAPDSLSTPLWAVSFGSLAGLTINFLGAALWVYRPNPSDYRMKVVKFTAQELLPVLFVQLFFWASQLRMADLPGLYMDAINPDYLAAQLLYPEVVNPSNAMPSAFGPILGALYHGTQNLLVGIPVFFVLGFNVFAVRVAQGLFGAAIIVLVQALIKKVTGNTAIAVIAGLGLATELAFIASFRTQNYIVLSGCVWLLGAMYFAITAPAEKQRLFLSGILTGLAIYSYFVFLFFVPAFIILGVLNTRSINCLKFWVFGLILGLQTYVFGYASLVVKLGGFENAIRWIEPTLKALAPVPSAFDLIQRFQYVWLYTRMSLSNWANEHLLFDAVVSGTWVEVKFTLLLVCAVTLMLGFANRLRDFSSDDSGHRSSSLAASYGFFRPHQIGWLLLSFWICALVFGKRMGAHHYSAWVPLLYLLIAFVAAHFSHRSRWKWAKTFPAVMFCLVVLLNLQQQQHFFDRLRETGGVGKSTNAINRLAEDALSTSPNVVYVFPDWGFMTPFNFLTSNQRRYVVDLSPATITQLKYERSVIKLAYWDKVDGERYRKILEESGYRVTRDEPYWRLDQKHAFWLMEAQLD